MPDDDRPIEPNEEEPKNEPPAAVQWMMQQASSGQSAITGSLPDTTGPWPALTAGSSERTLAAREQRISDALRGNEKLVEGMDKPTAEALLGLGIDMGRVIVNDTAGLSDAAAEDILQPRVRAVRRFMMAAGRAAAPRPAGTEAEPEEWLRQAALALGDRFVAPDPAETAAFESGWRALSGRPLEQIAALRRFIDSHLARRP